MIAHAELTKNAAQYIEYLISEFGNSYDELYGQDIELESLGNAIDALQFVKSKLGEHADVLELQRKKLLSNVTTAYDKDIENAQKESNQSAYR